MPIDVVWERRGAYKRYHGHVTGEELLQSIDVLHSDYRFDRLRYVISDCSDVKSFSVTEDQVQLVAAKDLGARYTNPHVLVAIVTTDDRIKALATLYAGPPLQPYPTKIFDTLDDARAWTESG